MNFDTIRDLIKNDLHAVDQLIREQLHSPVELINQIGEHIIEGGGKRIRPLLTLLVARALNHLDHKTISIAAIIELIHTATLLHDDVVDHSDLRRGLATANSIWGNAASVLVGDFLYSRSFQMMVALQKMEVMDVLAATTNRIAEGEVLQLTHVRDPFITEAQYFEIIDCKTAVLFRAASYLGALTGSKASPTLCEAMAAYGMHLGTAFQLLDDALDYTTLENTELGKNKGDDLAEGKPTLPLIYALRNGNAEQQAFLRDTILEGRKENFEKVQTIIQSTGALTYLKEKALSETQKAIRCLDVLDDSDYKTALVSLAQFAMDRSY